MKPAILFAAATCASALAVWLIPASAHIVLWEEDGPRRVAVFAPLWQLAVTMAVAGVAAVALWSARPRSPQARASRAHIVAPLIGLLLWVIPYWPWLPDRFPVLLVLAGPMKWVVLGGVVALSTARWGETTHFGVTANRRVVFIVSLAVYLALGLRSLTTIALKGDEPHYLIISQSLLADGDLKIENNHRRREYRSFTREELPPDYMQRGQNGEIYSIHAPGLSALLLPAFALAGAYGAMVMLCLTGALAALAVFELARLFAGSRAALVTWIAVALTVPFVPYAWSIFPEMPGAAIVAWAAVWLASPVNVSTRRWAARGVALALLPWLHTKFVILEAALGLSIAWRLRRERSSVVAFLLPAAISAIAWFGFFYVVYGTPNPEAPYGNYAREWVKLAFVPRGILGLLFDQKFGLIAYAPVYSVALVGLWLAMRDASHRWIALSLAAVATAFALSNARLYMWWGGWSAPARFLVPALPLLVPAIALAIQRAHRSAAGQALVTMLLCVSLAVSLISSVVPDRLLLFSDAHGVSRLADQIQGSAPLTAALPMFTESEWQPRDLVPRAYRPQERIASVVRGRLGLLDSFDANRRAFDYSTGRVLEPSEWRAAGTITAAIARTDRPPLPPSGIYDEGATFWTIGVERGMMLIAPQGHRRIDVTVHIGPTGGVCRTTVNGETRAELLQPGETRALTFEGIPADAAWVLVSVQANRAFRPVEVDPASQDARLLGCQVRVALR